MKLNPKSLVLAGALLGAGLAGGEQAAAMPVTPMPDARISAIRVQGAEIVQAGWRCGPGWHMNGWGRCVPNRYWRRW